MNTKHLFSNNRMAKAMLGVTKEEFDSLLPTFASALKSLVRDRIPERKRAVGAGQKGSFKTAEEKLAFILMYAKLNHYGLKAHRFMGARTKSPRGVIQE